jgi:hypothetical protein
MKKLEVKHRESHTLEFVGFGTLLGSLPNWRQNSRLRSYLRTSLTQPASKKIGFIFVLYFLA